MSLVVLICMVGMICSVVIEIHKEDKLTTIGFMNYCILAGCMLTDWYLDSFIYKNIVLKEYLSIWCIILFKSSILFYTIASSIFYKQWNVIEKFPDNISLQKRVPYKKMSAYATYACILIHIILYAFAIYYSI